MASQSTDSQATSQFLLHLEMELGLSPNTLTAYSLDLNEFSTFCDSLSTTILQATPETLSRYMEFLQAQRDLASSPIRRRPVTLKVFYRFALARNLSSANPPNHLDSARQWKKLPDVLSRETVAAL